MMGMVSEAAAAKSPARPEPESDPVFLALPWCPANAESEAWLEHLHIIETDCSPKVEQSLLVDLLNRSAGFAQSLADRTEVHHYQNPLASLNAYKHRLQAIRCEYVSAHLRVEELQVQLAESRSAIQRLERHAEFLHLTIEQMQASRGWKLLEKCRRWRRIASQLLGRILRPAGPDAAV